MSSIFQAGGALPADHPTYVGRQADRDALRAALNGDYLHVIAPRQLGKTSLLKRLAAKLGEMGWRCAYVDLSTLMDFAKPAWYAELGKELALTLTPEQIPALANQVDLRRYLLNDALPWSTGQPRIALFFDEVEGAGKARDADGTPFSDTFFMTLRNLYIQRDDYDGTLVVALAGAVNPSDLVKDPAISPFNVGQEIGLDDFTSAETRVLTDHLADLGLPVDETVHQAIYDWANGHPYLTQRICSELEKVAGDLTAITPAHVDHVVEQVILNPTNPLQRDKNLRHVAKMQGDLSEYAAQLWSRLRAGESIALAEASDDVYLELYLTGAMKLQAGRLVIRNRIYERTFTEKATTQLATAVDPQPRSEAMGKPIRVFISSTWLDLQPEREAVENALHRMQDTAFAGMEYFGSRPETPKEVSLAEVDRSDVYIGIFAHRYGSGITEAEYRRARQRDIPCLIYFKDDSVPVVPAHMERDAEKVAKLEALKHELKQHHTVSSFHSPDHLATQVIADLHNLLGSAPTAREEVPSRSAPKYQINIGEGRGIIIGDHAQVTQSFGNSGDLSRSSSGATPWLVQVRGEHRVYLIDQDGLRRWVPDGPTLESIPGARWEDIDMLASWEELSKFLPGRPLPSVVHGVKPWLVKVRGETEIYFIGEDDLRHRIVNPDAIASLNQRTEVNVLVSWNELEWFPPGQPLSEIPSMSSVMLSTPSATEVSADFTTLRIQHLADNIRQDMELLKDYEDALRYEDDPRRRARYRREIEQLRRSATRYQREYDELRAQVTGELPVGMHDIATQLRETGVKLYALLESLPEPFILPRDVPDFVDRDTEIERVLTTLRAFQAVGIFGLAGVGKTALATHAAWKLEPCPPDGILWHSVKKGDTLESLIGDIAAAFGEPVVRTIPDPFQRREAFRNLMGRKKALLVLDNVEHSEQVQEVLDLASYCAILITSRERLALPKLVEVIDLKSLPRDRARELFVSRCRRELDPAEQPIADSICQRLGDLALAIDLAAALVSTGRVGTLPVLQARLQQRPLATLEGVRAAFEVSYSSLSKKLQSLFSSLGVFSAESFSEEAVSAIHGGQNVGEPLGELVAQSLLQGVQDYGTFDQPELERYALHPLLRDFSQERLGKAGQEEIRTCHAKYFLDLAGDLGIQIQNPGSDAVLARLDQDLPDLRAAMEWATARLQAGQLDHDWLKRVKDAALAMGGYWRMRGYPDDWVDWNEKGIEAWKRLAPQEASIADLVKLWAHKGLALEFKGQFHEAARTFRQLWDTLGVTLELTEERAGFLDELPDPTPELDPSITQRARSALQIASPYYRDLAFTCLHIGVNEWRMGQKDNAWLWARRGYWIAAAGDVSLELARANNLLGILHRAESNIDQAIQHGEKGLDILRDQTIEDPSTKAAILNSLGVAYRQEGDFIKAIECSREAKALEKQLGNIINQANCSTGLAEALRSVGQYELAIAEGEEALAIYRRVGHTEGEIASLMDISESCLGQGEGEKALEIAHEMTRIFEEHAQRQDIFRMGAVVYTVLGRAYYEVGQFEQALGAAEQARDIAEQTGPKPFLRKALHLMAKVLRALERESEARGCEALANGLGE